LTDGDAVGLFVGVTVGVYVGGGVGVCLNMWRSSQALPG
jgi:hypothetical protein